MRIKICGLTRPEDGAAAASSGATYGGVILAVGSPRAVTAETAVDIFRDTGLLRCGVVVDESPDRMLRLAEQIELDVLQLHGEESPETVEKVRLSGGLEVWKAVRPRSADEFVAAVERYAAVVDGLLLDGWSASARGGTGARFPWSEVAARRDRLPPGIRLIAAGGLDSTNVGEVIRLLTPDVVDVSSGVERAPGIKSEVRIQEFATAVAAAVGEIGTSG